MKRYMGLGLEVRVVMICVVGAGTRVDSKDSMTTWALDPPMP